MKKDNSYVIFENDKKFPHMSCTVFEEENRRSPLDEFRFEESNHATAVLRIHKSLYSQCKVKKEIRSENNTLVETDSIIPFRKESDKELLIMSFSIDTTQLRENQSAIIKVQNSHLGTIGFANLVKKE